jgi:hypothetical protein
MIEQFVVSFDGLLIHSSTESGLIYFWVTTFVQRKMVVCYGDQSPVGFGLRMSESHCNV